METVPYAGWARCARLANPALELICPLEIGPRVIRMGRPGGPNLLHEVPEDLGQTGGTQWRLYGGHRLWHAPEDRLRTYEPDNAAPQAEERNERTLRLGQAVEANTHLQKTIEIEIHPEMAAARLNHRIQNKGYFAVELAPWAATVMAPGGRAILPAENFAPHSEALLPARPLVLWHYTDLSDPRWRIGARFLELRQEIDPGNPQKIGALNTRGWLACIHGEQVFVKTWSPRPQLLHTDFGSNCELFTRHDMIEVETLGPIARLEPGEWVEHEERWFLFEASVGSGDDALERDLMPLVQEALQHADAFGE